jgi:hypothetical protein
MQGAVLEVVLPASKLGATVATGAWVDIIISMVPTLQTLVIDCGVRRSDGSLCRWARTVSEDHSNPCSVLTV